jgi:glutaredoxin-like protein NrdH
MISAKIVVYSKNGCPNCDLTKAYLKKKGLLFEECNLDDADNREFFVSKYPGIRSMPQIEIDGHRIRGFEELLKCNIAK